MPRRHHPFLDAPPLRSSDAQAPASDLEGGGPHPCAGCGRTIEGPESAAYCIDCHIRIARRKRYDAERISPDELADRQVEREERRGQLERGRE